MKVIIEVLIFLLTEKMMEYVDLMEQAGMDVNFRDDLTVSEKLIAADKLLDKLNMLKGGEKNGQTKNRNRSGASQVS